MDIALHDALAKALDVPLHQLFGGKVRDRIPFCYPLARCSNMADVDANLERVRHRLDQGHTAFRYYFGADLDLDEQFLTTLRQRWGNTVLLNALDASGLFEVEDAIAAIQRLAPFQPNLVESPVRGRHDAPPRTSSPSVAPSMCPSASTSPVSPSPPAWPGTRP